MSSSLWTERYAALLHVNLVFWQVFAIRPLLTAHALLGDALSRGGFWSRSSCLYGSTAILYAVGLPVASSRALQSILSTWGSRSVELEFLDRNYVLIIIGSSRPGGGESLINVCCMKEWGDGLEHWFLSCTGSRGCICPHCPATGSKPMPWGLEMNYSNNKRTKYKSSCLMGYWRNQRLCGQCNKMRGRGALIFSLIFFPAWIIKHFLCEMENSPLCPQGPVQMPPSPGNLPSFLQLVTILPFPGFQNICPSLWSLEILPLLICVDILPTGLRVSCTASPLVSSTRMFLRTQPILLSTCRGAEGTTYFE